MDSKLTLKLDKNVIERAKKYAAEKKISLSRLIENYLDALTNDELNNLEISPFVKSIATGKQLPNEVEKDKLKDDYIDYLDRKYR